MTIINLFSILLILSLILVIYNKASKKFILNSNYSADINIHSDIHNIFVTFDIYDVNNKKLINSKTIKCIEGIVSEAITEDNFLYFFQVKISEDKSKIFYTLTVNSEGKQIFAENCQVKLEDAWGMSVI